MNLLWREHDEVLVDFFLYKKKKWFKCKNEKLLEFLLIKNIFINVYNSNMYTFYIIAIGKTVSTKSFVEEIMFFI